MPGGYSAARSGVLAAAEYAVASKMQNNCENQQDAGDVLEGSGVSKAFLQSAIGDRGTEYDNEKLKRFADLTEKKRLPLAHLWDGS